MTGYGRAAATVQGHHLAVEIRTVNHRFLELKQRGAGLGPALEEAIAGRVRAGIERGSVTVSLSTRGEDGGPRLDRERAHQVFRQLSALAAELGLAPPALADVLAHSGVVTSEAGGEPLEERAVLALVDQAISEAVKMRAAEGRALARELDARLAGLAAITVELQELAGQAAPIAAERLLERVRRVLAQLPGADGGPLDPSRLAQEVALIVDRGDITEELVRLGSHLEQARALVAGEGQVGRRLEFLLQEIGRELNTVGAKSWSAAISRRIVDAKSELEKLREQAQNVE